MVDCCQSDQPCYLIDLYTSTVSDICFIYRIISGTLYQFFGSAPVLWCLYLFFMCITFYLVLVLILQCLLLGVYVKDISRSRSDLTLMLNSSDQCILCSITCFKLDKLEEEWIIGVRFMDIPILGATYNLGCLRQFLVKWIWIFLCPVEWVFNSNISGYACCYDHRTCVNSYHSSTKKTWNQSWRPCSLFLTWWSRNSPSILTQISSGQKWHFLIEIQNRINKQPHM